MGQYLIEFPAASSCFGRARVFVTLNTLCPVFKRFPHRVPSRQQLLWARQGYNALQSS